VIHKRFAGARADRQKVGNEVTRLLFNGLPDRRLNCESKVGTILFSASREEQQFGD
jgi:hypothetical protein